MSRARYSHPATGSRLNMSPSAATPDAPPAVSGGRVLYLDFDGVLHPEDAWRPPGRAPYVRSPPGHHVLEHADLLIQVLMPFPDIRIVLSTSWVRAFASVARVARRLPEGLRTRVIGSTWHSRMDTAVFGDLSRGRQIVADVQRRQPVAWLALDDDDEDWPSWWRGRLVRTDPVLGISAPEVLEELQEKLAREMRDGSAADKA